jgi:hypothetical protein
MYSCGRVNGSWQCGDTWQGQAFTTVAKSFSCSLNASSVAVNESMYVLYEGENLDETDFCTWNIYGASMGASCAEWLTDESFEISFGEIGQETVSVSITGSEDIDCGTVDVVQKCTANQCKLNEACYNDGHVFGNGDICENGELVFAPDAPKPPTSDPYTNDPYTTSPY